MMENLKVKTQGIFKALKQKGWRVYDIKYLDGYFVFGHGEDSVVHFKIKGLKGWKFGIWWWEQDCSDADDRKGKKEKVLKWDFFGQYEKYIDKFKPSASTYVVEDNDYDDHYGVYRMNKVLQFIKKHPYVARAYEGGYRRDSWDYLTPYEAWKSEVKREWEMRRGALLVKHFGKKYLRLIRRIADEVLVGYKLVDNNKNGWRCSPRWTIIAEGFKDETAPTKKGSYWLIEDTSGLPRRLAKKVERFDKKVNRKGRPTWQLMWLYDYSIVRATSVFIKGKKEADEGKGVE